MKIIFKLLDHRVPKTRGKAGTTNIKFIARPRAPYDAVAYAAALEILG